MRKVVLMCAVVALVVFSFGCVGGGSVSGAVKPTADLTSFKTVGVKITTTDDMKPEEMEDLRTELGKALEKTGKWSLAENGELTISINVTSISRVSTLGRIALGVFAGRAKTEAEVVMTNRAGTVVAKFNAEAKSGGTAYSGGTGASLRNLAEVIVEEMTKS